jgi:sulfoxide reductase heme-binding subunit YedZ
MKHARWGKASVFALCLAPVGWLGWRAWNQDLTANPIEFITHFTGDWTLRLLVVTLAVTPLRQALGLHGLARYRRMLGLFAFFYGVLHLATYVWLDKFFVWPDIVKDLHKRPFITAGFTAFCAMAPLAVTSTRGWIRRLGGARWQMLHRLIYVSAIAGVVHYYWLVKSDVRLPLLYGGLVALLLAHRAARLKDS